jgi:hypothetical protein
MVNRHIDLIAFELQVRGGNLFLSQIGVYGHPGLGMLSHSSHMIIALFTKTDFGQAAARNVTT